MTDSQGMRFLDLVPVSQEPVKYVLSWGDEDSEDGAVEAEVMVVMRRDGGFLMALPPDVISEEQLQEGNTLQDDLLVGMSTSFKVPAMMFQDGAMVPVGVEVDVVVVDFHESVCEGMRPYEMEDFILRFSSEDPEAFPDPGRLVAKTMSWLREVTDNPRAASYTPEVTADSGGEAEQEPNPPMSARSKARQRRPGGATNSEKPKRPTTASLAAAMEGMTSTLQSLVERQQMLEQQMHSPPNPTTSALQRPLASQVTPKTVRVSDVARELQTPPSKKGISKMQDLALVESFQPPEVKNLELDKLGSQPDLATAMLAQSAALTTLVSQLASGQTDPMSELTTPGGAGVRGATGRARLQADLAAQKGLFFESVMKSMSRRMFPTIPSTMSYQEMMSQGICGSRYLERFGGYGKCRDIGVIQHQVMQCMDFLQVENVPAARDSLALLAVMLEQGALDGGRLDLGQILTLTDDPPSAIFTNKQISQLSKSRAFSPLADQRWVTTALAYIKELDTISTKRIELLAGASSSSQLAGPPMHFLFLGPRLLLKI